MNRLAKLFIAFVAVAPILGATPATPSQPPPVSAAPQTQPAKAPRFAKEIDAFEAADGEAMPPKNGVLFVGSSSIRLWKTLADDFPGVPVINRGFGGSAIADSVHYAPRIIIPYEPRIVLLYAGDNDIGSGLSPQEVFADYKRFVEAVHTKLPNTKIVYIAIKPSFKRWALVEKIKEANRLIAEHAKSSDKLGYVDIFTPMLGPDGQPRPELYVKDGLHMTEAGYKVWQEKIAPILK